MSALARFSRSARPLASRSFNRAFSVQTARFDEKSKFDADKGSVGSQFQPGGKAAQEASKLGGPFEQDGAIGKEFKKDGAVGGAVQDAAEQAQGDKPSVFDKDGAIGKQFTSEGAIGSTAQAVGGPFAKDGAVGKHFEADGKVGGTVQKNLGDK